MLNLSAKFSLLIAAFAVSLGAQAQFQVVNNGVLTSVQSGCIVSIKTGDLLNSSGTVSNAGRITVEGDFVNDDQVDGGGGSSGIFNVQNDWVNNGTFSADQSVFNLTGGTQQITGTSVSSFYNLFLVGPGVKTMTLDAEVSNILDLTDQELATGGNRLLLSSTSPAALAYNNGFVSSEGDGRLAWNTSSMSDYLFQVGSSNGITRIRPVRVTPSTVAPHTFEIRMANVNATSEGYDLSVIDADICDINDLFYHLVERTNGTDAADLGIHYVSADDGNWDKNLHWQNVPQWEDMTGSVQSISGGYDVLSVNGWNDFTEPAFGLGFTLPDVSIDGLVSATCVNASPIALSGTPFGGVFSGDGVNATDFEPASAGSGFHTLTYAYTDGNGCTGEESQLIQVYNQPTVALTTNGPTEICDGDTVLISATQGFTSYEWNTLDLNPGLEVTTQGAYYVTVLDSNGCEGVSATANITVHALPNPVITADGPLVFCEGESVTLSAGLGYGSYSWSNLATVPSINVGASGMYAVTVTNQFLCEGTSDSVEVEVTDMILGTIFNDGDSLWVEPQGADYQWFLNNDPIPGATGDSYMAVSSGNYTVQYIGDNGCPAETYILEFTASGVGIDENSILSYLDVYPNPGNGTFTIDGGLPLSADVVVSFTDMVGRVVAEEVRFGAVDTFRANIDLTELANGVYFVNVKVGSRQASIRYIKS